MSQLEKAIITAVNAHRGVRDANGAPYVLHPLRCLIMAQQLGLDEEAQAIAVLHDVVEDTDITLDYLRQHFSERIVAGVDALTRRKCIYRCLNECLFNESYFNFVRRASENPDARKIKMLDNADNLRPERKKPGKFSLPERYQKSLGILKNACIVAGEEDYVKRFDWMLKLNMTSELVTWTTD
jgi:(p)ppGpp synthase/HD superfamily hydrolase